MEKHFTYYEREEKIFKLQEDLFIMESWLVNEQDSDKYEAVKQKLDELLERQVEEDITALCDENSIDDIIFRNNLKVENGIISLNIIEIYFDNEEKKYWSEEDFMNEPNSIQNNSVADLKEMIDLITNLVKLYYDKDLQILTN